MIYTKDFIKRFKKKIDLPEQSVKDFDSVADKILSNVSYLNEYNKIFKSCTPYEKAVFVKCGENLSSLAKVMAVNEYTLHGVFVISLFEELEKEYIKRNVPISVFWETAVDFCCKNRECLQNKGVSGTFVLYWYAGFMGLRRFALGRFQYDIAELPFDFTTSFGMKLEKGTPCLYIHIPSTKIPLSDEIRLDSYKRAYGFYKDLNKDGKLIFCCHSWVLEPILKDIFPKDSNIIKFMNDFEIVSIERLTAEEYRDAWRVFGPASEGNLKDWPENTSIQRAMKAHFLAGEMLGVGEGVFVFDGEKILK